MSEYIKDIIIISAVLGIVSLLSFGEKNSKYIKYAISLVLVVTCLIPLVKAAVTMDFNIDPVKYENEVKIVEMCRENLEDELTAYLKNSFGEDISSVKLTVNSSDIENIKICEVYVTAKSSFYKERELKSGISNLLYVKEDAIKVLKEG